MKNDKPKFFKNNIYIVKLIWNICPSRVLLTLIMSLLSFASWTFYSVFFMRYLFGSPEGVRTFNEVIWFIWIVAAVNLVYYLIVAWYNNKFVPMTDIKINYEMNKILLLKAQSVDISCYETPEFYDSYTRATTEAYERAISVLKTCSTLISALLSSTYVIYTMCSITLFSIPFIIFPLIGNLYFGKKRSKILFEYDKTCVPFKRRQAYVNRVIYLRKYTGEVRLTNVFDILKEVYNVAIDGIILSAKKIAKKRFITTASQEMLIFPLAFQGMWFISALLAVKTHSISLGDFIVLSSAIVSITWMVRNFTDSLIQAFSDGNYIENLKHFLEYKPRIDENQEGIIPDDNVTEIEFRNVSFKYEGQKNYALENINLKMRSGTKNALVGMNGSGKSTFIKLLMRLYDPINGEILLNGINIKEYNIRAYRNLFGVAFQDFALFSETILENVLMKEIDNVDERNIGIEALKDSGIYDKVQTLKKQENTILTREFDNDGVELSGGEKQKIAIARAFAKNSPIVILDEPSSALDPIAEYNMYEAMNKLCDKEKDEKISIIVSHRLSSAAMSDIIYMFEKGCLVECDSHQNLMDKCGTYASMFKRQAENYLQPVGGNGYVHTR
jgi:ATP-binding cassette, subfamily B, bacterial